MKPFVGYDCRHLHWMVRAKVKISVLCILKQFETGLDVRNMLYRTKMMFF